MVGVPVAVTNPEMLMVPVPVVVILAKAEAVVIPCKLIVPLLTVRLLVLEELLAADMVYVPPTVRVPSPTANVLDLVPVVMFAIVTVPVTASVFDPAMEIVLVGFAATKERFEPIVTGVLIVSVQLAAILTKLKEPVPVPAIETIPLKVTVPVEGTNVPLFVHVPPAPPATVKTIAAADVNVPPALTVILAIVWLAVTVILCPFCMIKISVAARAVPFVGEPVSLVDQEAGALKLPVATLE